MLILSERKPFFFGLLATLVGFFILCIVDYRASFNGLCMDCDNDFGWPFKVYQSGGLVHATKIIWVGVVANLFAAIGLGVIVGAVCQLIWNRMLTTED